MTAQKLPPMKTGLTKPRLIWRAAGYGLPVYLSLGLFVMMLLIGFVGGFIDETTVSRWLKGAAVLSALIFAELAAGFFGCMARGLRLLRLQEKELGFRFRQDVAQVPVKRLEAVDDRWFIAWDGAAVLAFRRDFIKKVDHFKQIHGGRAATKYAIRLTDYQDRVYQLTGPSRSLKLLKKWFYAGNREIKQQEKRPFISLDSYGLEIPFSTTKSEILPLLRERNALLDGSDETRAAARSKLFSLDMVFRVGFQFSGEKLTALSMSPEETLEGGALFARFRTVQRALEQSFGRPFQPLRSIMNLLDRDGSSYRWQRDGIMIEHSLFNRFGMEENISIRWESGSGDERYVSADAL